MSIEKEMYIDTLHLVRLCAVQLATYPVAEALEAARLCQTTGPILDPTAWIKGSDKLAIDIEFLEAAAKLAGWGRKLLDAHEAEIGALEPGRKN